MRRFGTRVAASTLFLLAGVVSAAEPAGAPQPSPEQRKLGYFVGNWTSEGIVKEDCFGDRLLE